jgi:hypothetical protein
MRECPPPPFCRLDAAGQVLLFLQAAAAAAAGEFHLFSARSCVYDARPDGCGSGIADLHGQQQQQQHQQLGGVPEILEHKRLFVMRLRGAGTKEMKRSDDRDKDHGDDGHTSGKKQKKDKKKKKKKESTSPSGWSAMQDGAGGKQGQEDGSSGSSESEDQDPPDGPASDSYVTRYAPSSPRRVFAIAATPNFCRRSRPRARGEEILMRDSKCTRPSTDGITPREAPRQFNMCDIFAAMRRTKTARTDSPGPT